MDMRQLPDDEGYLAIWRRFFRHPFWQEKRKFSRAEAWIDILRSTHFEDEPRKVLVRGRLVEVGYGQCLMTTRYCGERWGWHKTACQRFFKLLSDMEQISIICVQQMSLITVLNYERYDPRRASDVSSDVPVTCQWRASDVSEKKNIESNRNIDHTSSPLPPSWKNSFESYLAECEASASKLLDDPNWITEQQQVNPGVDIHLTMRKAFSNYWGTEEAWKKLKRKKTQSINWKSTWQNAISNRINRVYLDKQPSRAPTASEQAREERADQLEFLRRLQDREREIRQRQTTEGQHDHCGVDPHKRIGKVQ
jgi:hypothetical protein